MEYDVIYQVSSHETKTIFITPYHLKYDETEPPTNNHDSFNSQRDEVNAQTVIAWER